MAGNIMAFGGFFLSEVSGRGSSKALKMSSKAETLRQKNPQPDMRGFFLPCPPNQITEIQMMGPTYHHVDMQQKEVLKLHQGNNKIHYELTMSIPHINIAVITST